MKTIERSSTRVAYLLRLVMVATVCALCGIAADSVNAVSSPELGVEQSGRGKDDSRKGSGKDESHKGSGKKGIPKATVWVVNRDLGELAIFDAETGKVIKTIPVGAGAHDIAISDRARKAYITAETINTVTTVDTWTLDTAAIGVTPLPHHIESSANGRRMYVSLASHPTTPAPIASQLAVIDTEDDSVTYMNTSNNPLARAHGMNLSPDRKTLYVAHDTGNEVTGVDIKTGQIVGLSVTPIVRAEEPLAGRYGNLLWVSSRGDGTVKRIDLETNTIPLSVPVGNQPESLMLTPTERTLVVSLRSPATVGGPALLAFVDTVNLTLRGTVAIAGPGTFGDLAVMSPNGRHVYATFDAGQTGIGGVAVVDVATRTVVATWPYPGTGRPHGIAYLKRRSHF